VGSEPAGLLASGSFSSRRLPASSDAVAVVARVVAGHSGGGRAGITPASRSLTQRKLGKNFRDLILRCREAEGYAVVSLIFVRSTLECGDNVTALGGRWNRDDALRLMLATSSRGHRPPPSQSGGSIATALQSFAKSAGTRASIIVCAGCGAHFVRSTLECGDNVTALGGWWNR